MKKRIACLLALCMLVSLPLFAGCKIAQAPGLEEAVITPAGAEGSDGTQAAAPAAGEDAVFAKVGDTEISFGEYMRLFEQYSYYSSMFGMDVSTDAAMLAQMQDMVRDIMLEEAIIRYQAEKNGVASLNAEQQAEVDAQAEEIVAGMRAEYEEMALAAKESDESIDVESYIANLIADDTEYSTGTAMTEQEYLAWLKEQASVNFLRDNLIELLCSDAEVSDEDVQAWYEETLASDEAYYTENPAAFKSAEEGYLCAGAQEGYLPVAYVPEGYSRVMDLRIAPKADVHELYPEYEEKRLRMEEIEAEYGAMAFADAVQGDGANRAQLDALLKEYKALETETAGMAAEAGREALAAIEEAYAKLEDGGSFESIHLQYSENDAAANCEALMTGGLLLNPEANDGSWSEDCIEEFEKLEMGQYSPIFMDEDGYHILYYRADVESGARPLSELEADARASLLEDAQYEAWQELLSAWMLDESVEVNEEVYRQAGAASAAGLG